jgi:polyisoprenoid-binding protein YceI
MSMKKIYAILVTLILLLGALPVVAADYVIDTKGAHAAIEFRIKHLGFSWLLGRFNKFDGSFSYDEKDPAASRVEVVIDAASIDSNHAERDKHLRGEDFLEVEKFPTASFFGTSYQQKEDGTAVLTGDLTLHGVTRKITIDVAQIGHGQDPWGGYRRGFSGTTTLTLKDYGIKKDLGPASQQVELFLYVEGIRR